MHDRYGLIFIKRDVVAVSSVWNVPGLGTWAGPLSGKVVAPQTQSVHKEMQAAAATKYIYRTNNFSK